MGRRRGGGEEERRKRRGGRGAKERGEGEAGDTESAIHICRH